MEKLHIILFPAMAQGHMIPILDMAKLLLLRGVKTTIIATPAFTGPVAKAQNSGHDIKLIVTKFPPESSSLPENIVSFEQTTTPDLVNKFILAMELLQEPFEKILQELQPNCLISDMFLPWTVDSAAKFGVPRLVFYGSSSFTRCVSHQMERTKPHMNVSSDSEPFVLDGLPKQLSFVRSQISPFYLQEGKNYFMNLFNKINEAEEKTYGEVVNSFYELESDYADYYKNVIGRKAWHIGPLWLWESVKSEREKKSAIDENECLSWLDSKKPNSVVFVCFGSLATFSEAQLHETAVGLDSSGQDFIWVIRKSKNQENEDWLPNGFEERVKGKGLIIRGWAPQVMILDHPSVGAFVTHCGWNSILEGICAGLPMVTWPVSAEQFFNEKLVVEVLGTGLSVGNKRWMRVESEGVGREAVAKAVEEIMVGPAAAEMRMRAECYKETAKKAVEEEGSSYNNLNVLIEELSTYVPTQRCIN